MKAAVLLAVAALMMVFGVPAQAWPAVVLGCIAGVILCMGAALIYDRYFRSGVMDDLHRLFHPKETPNGS